MMLNSDIAQRELVLIGSKEMPEEDFEKLSWKISVMRHLQEIKQEHPDRNDPERKSQSVLKYLKEIKVKHPDKEKTPETEENQKEVKAPEIAPANSTPAPASTTAATEPSPEPQPTAPLLETPNTEPPAIPVKKELSGEE